MKKHFLIIFLFLGFLIPSFGQMQFSVGAKAGFASAGLNRNEYGKKSVDALLAGAVLNFSFTELFSLQLEGNYMQKGGGYGFKYNKDQYFDYFRFRVVEVPLLAKFTIGEPRVKFIGTLGSYLGYTINIERKYDDPDAGISEVTKYNNFFSFDDNGVKPNRWDVGLVIGTGFSVDIGKGRMFVEGRYAAGFMQWFRLNPVTFDNSTLKDLSHRAVSISVGYTLPVWSRN